MKQLPAVFISHGMPSMALAPGPTGRFLASLPAHMARPRAILCISAHLEGTRALLTTDSRPETLHDFGGFGTALHAIRYPAPGHPKLAERIVALLRGSGIPAAPLPDRGFDHGAWVPLSLMYPEANIPVIQLSIQTGEPPVYHFALGRALAPLRAEGLLILASGGATHDLSAMPDHPRTAPPEPYAEAFDAWLENVITAGEIDALQNYRQSAPHAEQNHPYPHEHFLPLMVAAGAATPSTAGRRLHRHFEYGVLSLAAYRWD